MARNMRLATDHERMAEMFDESDGDHDFMDYGSEPAAAPRSHSAPDYSVPLFLAEQGAVAGPGVLGILRRWDWQWLRSFGYRIDRYWLLPGGIVAAVAALTAFAVINLDASISLFASTKAMLVGTLSHPADAEQTEAAAAEAGDSSPSAPANQATVGLRTTPTRDEIALALKSARQDVADSSQGFAAVPARTLDPDEVAGLLKRARGLIVIGDIVAARLLLERAADSQDVAATFLLAQTFDAAVLGKPDQRTVAPDPAAARSWYERAAGLGSLNAKQRLAQMQN